MASKKTNHRESKTQVKTVLKTRKKREEHIRKGKLSVGMN